MDHSSSIDSPSLFGWLPHLFPSRSLDQRTAGRRGVIATGGVSLLLGAYLIFSTGAAPLPRSDTPTALSVQPPSAGALGDTLGGSREGGSREDTDALVCRTETADIPTSTPVKAKRLNAAIEPLAQLYRRELERAQGI